MEAVKIGEEGSASMATNNRKLSIEDYLDLIKNRDHNLNAFQLGKVISPPLLSPPYMAFDICIILLLFSRSFLNYSVNRAKPFHLLYDSA